MATAVEDLPGFRALEEQLRVSAGIRAQILVSYDETDGNSNNAKRSKIPLEPDYENFIPRRLPPLVDGRFVAKHWRDKGFRFFYQSIDYEIDQANNQLAINMWGFSDTTWATDVTKEQKNEASYNIPTMLRVWGFQPYFFVKKLSHWTLDSIHTLIQCLDTILIEQYPFAFRDRKAFVDGFGQSDWVTGFEIIEGIPMPRYRGNNLREMVKIYVRHPRMVAACRQIFENPGGKVISRDSLWKPTLDEKKKAEEDDDEEEDEEQDDGVRSEAEQDHARTQKRQRRIQKHTDLEHLKAIFAPNYGGVMPPGKFLPSTRDLSGMSNEDEHALQSLRSYIYYPRSDYVEHLLARDINEITDEDSEDLKEIVYEADVEFKNRFIIDKRWKASTWYFVPLDKAEFVEDEDHRISRNCPIELVVRDHNDMYMDTSEESQVEVPNLIQASFDDEMETPLGRFPTAEKDSILQRGLVYSLTGNPTRKFAYVFALKQVAKSKPHDYITLCYESETAMLRGYFEFMEHIDIDIFLGWNINCFDWPFNIARGERLGLETVVRNCLSRHKTKSIYLPPPRIVKGKRVGVCSIPGRLNIDCMKIIQSFNYPDNRLNYAADRLLGKVKESFDVHLINTLQQSEMGREKIAEYVKQDALLPLAIFDKLNHFIVNLQVSKIAIIPVQDVYDRAQGAKIDSKLRQECLDNPSTGQPRYIKSVRGPGYSIKQAADVFEGASVLDPDRDYYEHYVFVLDFNSMYPTIIRALNICYTTLITKETIARLGLVEGVHYWQVPNFVEQDGRTVIVPDPDGYCFLKKSVKEGILPRMERELGAERARIRVDQRNYELKSFLWNLLEGQQLGIKVWMNSVYGLSGDTTSGWFLVALAATITKMGRWMISSIKTETEWHFRKQALPLVPPPDPTREAELGTAMDSRNDEPGFLISWDAYLRDPEAYEAQLKAYEGTEFTFVQETFPFNAQVVYGDTVRI